jgi:hypothetical protein
VNASFGSVIKIFNAVVLFRCDVYEINSDGGGTKLKTHKENEERERERDSCFGLLLYFYLHTLDLYYISPQFIVHSSPVESLVRARIANGFYIIFCICFCWIYRCLNYYTAAKKEDN